MGKNSTRREKQKRKDFSGSKLEESREENPPYPLLCVGKLTVDSAKEISLVCGGDIPLLKHSALAHKNDLLPYRQELRQLLFGDCSSVSAPHYQRLPAGTNLNIPPSLPPVSDHSSEKKSLPTDLRIRICEQNFAVSSLMKSGPEIDVIAPAYVLKQIFNLTYSKAQQLSIAVQLVGQTLVLGTGYDDKKPQPTRADQKLHDNFAMHSVCPPLHNHHDRSLRDFSWKFKKFQMLVGSSDLHLFSDEEYPLASVLFKDITQDLEPFTWFQAWLDNIMASVPRLAICHHRDGVLKSYEFLKTDSIFMKGISDDGTPAFQPHVVAESGHSILTFLKENCNQDTSSYWLYKSAGDDVLQLFDLLPADSSNSYDDSSSSMLFMMHKGRRNQIMSMCTILFRAAQLCLLGTPKNKDKSASLIRKCKELSDKCQRFLDEKDCQVVRAFPNILSKGEETICYDEGSSHDFLSQISDYADNDEKRWEKLSVDSNPSEESSFLCAVDTFRQVNDITSIVLIHLIMGHGRREGAENLEHLVDRCIAQNKAYGRYDEYLECAKLEYNKALEYFKAAKSELSAWKEESGSIFESLKIKVYTECGRAYLRYGMLLARKDVNAKDRAYSKEKISPTAALLGAISNYRYLGELREQELAMACFELGCVRRDCWLRDEGEKYYDLAKDNWKEAMDLCNPLTYPTMYLEILAERSDMSYQYSNTLPHGSPQSDHELKSALSALLKGRVVAESIPDSRYKRTKVDKVFWGQLKIVMEEMMLRDLCSTKLSRLYHKSCRSLSYRDLDNMHALWIGEDPQADQK